MTKTYLQNLSQLELVQIAMKLRILPPDFLKIRQIQADLLPNIEESEHEDLINEVFEILAEQHSESLNDLTSPLLESLHKFEMQQDCISGLTNPLPYNYFADRLGLTKNRLHFILRDMKWAVLFWQLSSYIRNLIIREEQQILQNRNNKTYDGEESSLSIVVHESTTMPRLAHQSKFSSFRGNFWQDKEDYSETDFYSFSVSRDGHKCYVYLREDCNYYWAELYHCNNDYHSRLLLARSPIIFKPKLFQLERSSLSASFDNEKQIIRQLYELSDSIPEYPESNPAAFPSVNIA